MTRQKVLPGGFNVPLGDDPGFESSRVPSADNAHPPTSMAEVTRP
jgi:hypothetical protein